MIIQSAPPQWLAPMPILPAQVRERMALFRMHTPRTRNLVQKPQRKHQAARATPQFASMLFHCILAGTEGNTNRLTVPRYSPGSVATTTETYPITITPSWMGPIMSRTGVCRLGHSNQFYTLSACPHWRTSNDLTPKNDMELYP